jgi:hypothetical protein
MKTINIEMYKHIIHGYTVITEEGFYSKKDTDYVLTATGTGEFEDVSEKDQQLAAVEQLRQKKQSIMAQTEITLEKIEEKIQSLLAIAQDYSGE